MPSALEALASEIKDDDRAWTGYWVALEGTEVNTTPNAVAAWFSSLAIKEKNLLSVMMYR